MKFTIRDLLLVTVIVALVLGWWVEHWRQAAEWQEHRVAYEREVRRMEELVYSLDINYGIKLTFGTRGGVSGVTQYGRRIPPIIKLPMPSAPAPNPPKK